MCSAIAHPLNGLYKEHRKTPQSIFKYNFPEKLLLITEITGPVMRYSLCLKHLLPAVHASFVFDVLPPVTCLLLLRKQKVESYSQKQKLWCFLACLKFSFRFCHVE